MQQTTLNSQNINIIISIQLSINAHKFSDSFPVDSARS